MSRPTQDTAGFNRQFAYGTFTLYGLTFQLIPLQQSIAVWQSYNPEGAETPPVWAVPRSLATTEGITFVFFSCRY